MTTYMKKYVFDKTNDCYTPEDKIPFGIVSHLHFMLSNLLRNRNIVEISCGWGWSIGIMSFDAMHYVGIDSSESNIILFKNLYPSFQNRIHKTSFDNSLNLWENNNPIIIATFGAASYLKEKELDIIEKSGKDYILMFYQEDKCIKGFEGTHYYPYTLDEIHTIIPSAQILPYYECYIASNMSFHEYEINRITTWELEHLELLLKCNKNNNLIPYDRDFRMQMESIMRDGDILLYIYFPYIQKSLSAIDFTYIIKKYEYFKHQCECLLPLVCSFERRDIESIINSITKRIILFKYKETFIEED